LADGSVSLGFWPKSRDTVHNQQLQQLADCLDQPPSLANQLGDCAAHGNRLACRLAVLQGIPVTSWGSAASSVHPAHVKAPDRWRAAWLAAAL
jgi:hypothetical protein